MRKPKPKQRTKIENAYFQAAKEHVSEGDLELDDNAVISISDDGGAYVQMWQWVPDEDANVCHTHAGRS